MYNYNYTVKIYEIAGDKKIKRNIKQDTTITLNNNTQYYVNFTGKYPHLMFNNSSKIVRIQNWGDNEWKNMSRMFKNARNLKYDSSKDKPNLNNVKNMCSMFNKAKNFNGNGRGKMNEWNTSNVTDMNRMFRYAEEFNGDISDWNTSSVTDMSYMFHHLIHFNNNISSWNTSSVTNMRSMFEAAYEFNQDISSWNTSNVNNMDYTFYSADRFNQDLSNWCVKSINDIPTLFDHYHLGSIDEIKYEPLVWNTNTGC